MSDTEKLNEAASSGLLQPRLVRHYDYWIKPCGHCGYDEGKSTPPKKGNHRCWKCGRRVQRDFSDRALRPEFQTNDKDLARRALDSE
jgi:PHP family Zn ribbon phosphoesterase